MTWYFVEESVYKFFFAPGRRFWEFKGAQSFAVWAPKQGNAKA